MNELYIELNNDKLMKEFFYYMDHHGQCNLYNSHNQIIKFFQQDVFFKKEKELWQDPIIREKLILNRIKYLHKLNISNEELLAGFKKSGIYYGYSHFNPLLAKWFYEQYNIHSCYDPCGGWGHRMLGSFDLDTYIYNDISQKVIDGIKNIIDFFDIQNVKIYNEDASVFIPSDDFESIFTCPPYGNLENYETQTPIEKLQILLQNLYNIFNQKETCKYMGIVIREDLNSLPNWNKKIELISNHIHFIKKKKYKEYLYIYKK